MAGCAIMGMLVRHLRDNAAAWACFLRAPLENIPSKLMTVGGVTCGVAACAVTSRVAACAAAASPPADVAQLICHPCAGLGAAALAFICGIFLILAAFWVAGAAARRGAIGHMILCASLTPLVIVLYLSGSDNAELIFDTVFEAIQA